MPCLYRALPVALALLVSAPAALAADGTVCAVNTSGEAQAKSYSDLKALARKNLNSKNRTKDAVENEMAAITARMGEWALTALKAVTGAYNARAAIHTGTEKFDFKEIGLFKKTCRTFPEGTAVGYYVQIEKAGWHHICDGGFVVKAGTIHLAEVGGTWASTKCSKDEL